MQVLTGKKNKASLYGSTGEKDEVNRSTEISLDDVMYWGEVVASNDVMASKQANEEARRQSSVGVWCGK